MQTFGIGRVGQVDLNNKSGIIIVDDDFVRFDNRTLFVNCMFELLNIGNIVLCEYNIDNNALWAKEITLLNPLLIVK